MFHKLAMIDDSTNELHRYSENEGIIYVFIFIKNDHKSKYICNGENSRSNSRCSLKIITLTCMWSIDEYLCWYSRGCLAS